MLDKFPPEFEVETAVLTVQINLTEGAMNILQHEELKRLDGPEQEQLEEQ